MQPSTATGGAGCSDSWLGDGECDLCLLAKYGYDAAPGGTNDCVAAAAGQTNSCADLGHTKISGAWYWAYMSYTATH